MTSINENHDPYTPFTHATVLEFSAWLKSPEHTNQVQISFNLASKNHLANITTRLTSGSLVQKR